MNQAEAAIISSMIRKVEANCMPVEGDYKKDGLVYCHKCHTPKQVRLEGWAGTFPVLCQCESEKRKEAERLKEEYERFKRVERNRQEGFSQSDMQGWTFSADDGKDSNTTNAMRKYVENFAEMKKNGKGLLLYGRCGSGKTYAAACVANALIDEGYSCLMTTFSRIANTISGMYEKQAYLDSLNNYALLVLDDLGVERNTKYMDEIIFNIIDGRYRAGLPMIITTNLDIEVIKHPQEIAEQRIYNRILERCFPLAVNAIDRRVGKIWDDYDTTKQLLGL